MKINWPHYLEQAVSSGQTTQALARQIRNETGSRVNISEVRMRLEHFKQQGVESSGRLETDERAEVRVLELSSVGEDTSTCLKIRTGGIEFEFQTNNPASSVAAVLVELKGVMP